MKLTFNFNDFDRQTQANWIAAKKNFHLNDIQLVK